MLFDFFSANVFKLDAPTISILFSLVATVLYLSKRPKKLNLPIVGKQTDNDFRKALEDGDELYPNRPWLLPTPMHPTVVLPQSMINEIKDLPETSISLRQHHYTINSGKYTKFGEYADELDAVIRQDLTRAVDLQLAAFQDEAPLAFEEHVGHHADFTEVPLYMSMLKIISSLSSRVFVGLPFSRDPEWVETTAQYTIEAATGAHRLSAYPHMLRPIVGPFVMRSVAKRRARARQMMQAVLDRFMTEDGEMRPELGEGLISWIIPRYGGNVTAERLARDQLIATYVAIHTTTILLTQSLFDLAARPEYIKILEEELRAVLATEPSGQLTKNTINKLSKLDSFIKESQRINPPGLVSMLRRVTDPDGLKLSTGDVIPHGYTISINTHVINMRYGPEFDGLRHDNLRKQGGHETSHTLARTGIEDIAFGHGTHSCPGRFFAIHEIKVIICHILLNYDIKMGDGKRPESLHRGATVTPPSIPVLFKSRA